MKRTTPIIAIVSAAALAAGGLALASPAQAHSQDKSKSHSSHSVQHRSYVNHWGGWKHHNRNWNHNSGKVTGTTTVSLSAEAVAALTPLSPAAVAPATLGVVNGSVQATFPIVGKAKKGVVHHTGGLSLTNGTRTLKLTDFNINTNAGVLTSVATLNGYRLVRVPLFDVALDAVPTAGCDASATLTMNTVGALALQVVFDAPDLTGANVGTACVDFS